MKVQYAVLFADNSGNFAADAIATTVEARILANTQKFDGELDHALFEVPSGNVQYFEQLLDEDTNVVSYRELL